MQSASITRERKRRKKERRRLEREVLSWFVPGLDDKRGIFFFDISAQQRGR